MTQAAHWHRTHTTQLEGRFGDAVPVQRTHWKSKKRLGKTVQLLQTGHNQGGGINLL